MKTNYNLRWLQVSTFLIPKMKNTLLTLFLFCGIGVFAQTLNQPANWPNTNWTLSGTFDASALLNDPTTTANFSYDDDAAGGGSTDILSAESPVIDLTSASTAGETLITVEYNYDYNLGDIFDLEYFDADASSWVTWEALPDNSATTGGWCSNITAPNLTSIELDISSFTANQLSNFQYRFFYDASSVWGWGFCVSSPTIFSQAPPTCPMPQNLTASNVTFDSADLSWDDVTDATLGFEWSVFLAGADPAVDAPVDTNTTGVGVTTVNVTGLTSQTDYDFYVSSDCDTNGTSTLAGPESFTTLAIPPANDECSQAIALTVNSDFNCSSVTSGTTVGATASPQTDDVTGTPDNDVWFSFVATQTQHQVSLENVVAVTGFSTDMGMGLYDGTAGCGALVFVDDSDPNTLSASGLTIGTTYFVRVYGWSSTNSAQTTFDVCVGTPPAPPANDDLCDAIALTVDATSAGDAYTNVSATAQTDEPVPGCFSSGIGGSVWFTFVAPASGSVEVSTDIAGGTMTDTEIAVYEAPTDCTDLTTLGAELGCDQDGGDTVNFNSIVNLAGLTAGDTYYVQVDQWSGSSSGGTFGIEVKESLASVQIIHNSADPAAEFVDVYVNGVLTLDDFEFRTATPFVDLPAGVAIDVDIAPSTSVDVTESIFNLNTTLTADETYIAVANGVLDTTQFDDSVNTIDFNIDVFAGAQQASTNPGETSVLVHHGSTDAPTVDVREISVPAGIIVDDISYPEFDSYLDLANQDYQLALELGDNSAVVENYLAPLQTLGLADAAITVVASGFLDPAANQSGPAFGLWVALPAGGPLVELPTFTPPPANDDLCDAIPITVGAPLAGDAFTNLGATEETNEPIPACFSSGIGGSVWFTFDAPASGEVSVTTDIAGGTLTDTEVAVYDAPTDCTDLTTLGAELGCDQDGGTTVGFNSIVNLTGLTPGTTYYVQVDQWSGTFAGGTFGIKVLDTNPPCPEPQNLNVTNVTTNSADLNWDDVTEATLGFEWSVYLAGDDPAVDTPVDTNTTGVGVTTVNVTGLTASTTYDFYVSSDCDTDGTSILAGPVSFITLSVNDECSGALPATVTAFGDTSQPINFDTTGAQDATVVPSCEGFDSTESDLWYTFTTNATAGVTLSLLSGDANDLEGAIYDSCGGAELFCFADGSSVDFSSDVLVTGLAPNTAYVLQVYTEGFSEGAFSLAITDLPACPEPQNLNVTNVTSDSADLNWDDVTEATVGFEWFVFLAGDDPAVDAPVDTNTTGVGVTTANVTGLTPQTDYDFYVSSDCDTNGTSTLAGPESFSTLALPPANDDLCDAIALTINATSAGDAFTNVGATAQTDEPVPGCFSSGIGGSVWFTFVAPASGSVEVSTDIAGGTMTDTEVAVYEAPTDCTDLTTLGAELGCDQDGGTTVGFNSIVNLSGLTPGVTYYIQVDQWSGTSLGGTFGIVVTSNLSTASFDDNNFSFYPNPADNRLNLQTTSQVQEVKVYNMLGQEVMKETPNTVSPSLNVEALQVGTYIMNITIDGTSANFRFIKK